jgi:hypothetical protein
MAGSWREILECARADEADADESARSGETFYDPENRDGEHSPSGEAQPQAGPRGFDEPELTAFLTRLASPPDAPAERPAPGRTRQALVREKAANDLLMSVRASSSAPAPLEPEKPAELALPPPPDKARPRRSLLAKPLLATAAGLLAFVLLLPGKKAADVSPSPQVIETSRIRTETPSTSHSSRAVKGHHKRAAATRPETPRRCLSGPDLPSCRWHRFRDRE